MNYEETCEWLFCKTANFEHQGQTGYKVGLDNMLELDRYYGHPHRDFRCIHVTGTNGKGSVSHTIAAVLQMCGYKVGLYTSPHVLNFNERIRINGKPISEDYVVRFVEEGRERFESLGCTFFEIATEMAFKYFCDEQIDIAVVEVGLGGRLDSTNIITPILSVITNVSLEHTQILGKTIEQIAHEKGGIIKEGVPVVIGEASTASRKVFESLAQERHAPIRFAEDEEEILSATSMDDGSGISYETVHWGKFKGELSGTYQLRNTRTILCAIDELAGQGIVKRQKKVVKEAFSHVSTLTGLMARWQTVSTSPTVICDIGHNTAAWEHLGKQLAALKGGKLHIVFGMVSDKDFSGVLALAPKNATYYFTQPTTHRALPVEKLQVAARQSGLTGDCYETVEEAFAAARKVARKTDFIFVGGSNYVVADFLKKCV